MNSARHEDPDIADEYDLSNALRGEHAERMKDGFTTRVVSDEEDRLRQARLVDEAAAERGQADDQDLHR